ncbi:MAG: hypothetical protein Q9187_006153 [Circinaria calcarea]
MQILELPPDIRLELLAEGAANIVYRLIFPPRSPTINSESYSEDEDYGPDTPPPTEIPMLRPDQLIKGKLLRLRKDLLTSTSVFDAQQAFEECIKPRFSKDDLVEQDLIRLPPGLVETCNKELRRTETEMIRPRKRHGVYLSSAEPYGIVVTDMSLNGHEDVLGIEFKPKWLAQSPSAPAGARRCRTCALRMMRIANNRNTGEQVLTLKESFCPLNLVSLDRAKVAATINDILRGSSCSEPLSSRILDFIYQSPLLPSLKEQQVQLDPIGVFAISNDSIDFMTAMTLRDCTLFVKINQSQDFEIEARLGDLDLKSPSKFDYWRSLERELIDGGWYTGTKEYPAMGSARCSLEAAELQA